MNERIFILGATGFVGRHLVDQLLRNVDVSTNITILTRNPTASAHSARVTSTYCDLFLPHTLINAFQECDVLINLAYNREYSGQQNVEMIENLLNECAKDNIKKIIHVSTALIFSSDEGICIDEAFERQSNADYKMSKLKIEHLFSSKATNSEVIVLRPTIIFGPGGINLDEFTKRLLIESPLRGSLRASIAGQVPMNLVPVQTVVESVIFFLDFNKCCSGVYLVSQDDDETNCISAVDKIISNRLNIKRPLASIPIPKFAKKIMLKIFGIKIEKKSTYSNGKLRALGFDKFYDLKDALDNYCRDFSN